MKKHLLSLFVLLVIALPALGDPPPAALGWEGAVFYDTGSKQTAVGAMHPLTVFHDFLFKGFTINLNGFAGIGSVNQTPIAAVALMAPFKVSGDGKFVAQLGLGVSGSLGGPLSVGPAASVSIRF